ncbi:hypothetical protein PMZ80_007980 [Knufia obscura]|uniref:C2H2-type domain-containing protein n=1 Tax=Knufia obscura TaxID=1635080 RepID=A0ABR0RG50_9EURO|nr:hypothetical protein PMZ80_007980 [Knufia obscura]
MESFMQSPQPRISIATTQLVFESDLSGKNVLAFEKQVLPKKPYGSVVDFDPDVHRKVIDELLESSTGSTHREARQRALISLLGDIGYSLGYRIRALECRPFKNEDMNAGERIDAEISDTEFLRPARRSTQAGRRSLRDVLQDVTPKSNAMVSDKTEAPTGYKFHCVIPDCRQKSAVATIGGLRDHLVRNHYFSEKECTEILSKSKVKPEDVKLKQLFGPYPEEDLLKDHPQPGKMQVGRTKKKSQSKSPHGSVVGTNINQEQGSAEIEKTAAADPAMDIHGGTQDDDEDVAANTIPMDIGNVTEDDNANPSGLTGRRASSEEQRSIGGPGSL